MQSVFSLEQQSIITGSMLGDGHISEKRYGNCYFQKNQCGAHRDYVLWHCHKFKEFARPFKEGDNYALGKKYSRAIFSTKAMPEFTALRKLWYPEGKKIVPRTIEIDPLALAIWYFDDGSNNVRKRQCRLATYCFSKDDCEFLVMQLNGLKIKTFVLATNVIQVCTESYKLFVDTVKPFMLWNCFNHKVQYRDAKKTFISHEKVAEIMRLFESGKKYKQIVEEVGETYAVVSQVVAKRKGTVLAVNNTSGQKGITWDKARKKWKASVCIDGKRHSARFDSIEDAEKWRKLKFSSN